MLTEFLIYRVFRETFGANTQGFLRQSLYYYIKSFSQLEFVSLIIKQSIQEQFSPFKRFAKIYLPFKRFAKIYICHDRSCKERNKAFKSFM